MMGARNKPGERILLDGAVNFRDIGGYDASDGRTVRKGCIYRSDSLATLTPEDHERLRRIGMRLVVDLRSPAEVDQAPDCLPDEDPPEYLNLPVSREDFDTVAALERLKKGDTSWLTDTFMADGYRNNIDLFADTWGLLFSRMVEEGGRPLVFHCTAGKDRTGICAALILLVLGVSEETVIYDHGLSNIYIKDKLGQIYAYLRSIGVDPEAISEYFTAPRDAMVSALDHLRSAYGSAEAYLINKAGVSPEMLDTLREELLD